MSSGKTKLLVLEDLYGMPDDGLRYELLYSRLVAEPSPGGRHGRIVATLVELVGAHVRKNRLGVVLTGNTGFVLHHWPDTVRAPDIAFVTRERYEALDDESQAIPGAPDLAIEVISPGDKSAAVHEKVADWLAAHTAAVWVVDPQQQQVRCFRSLFEPLILSGSDLLRAEDLLPGFSVPVAEIFSF